MSSLNSLPFPIETRIKSWVLFQNSYGSQFLPYQHRKPFDCGGSTDRGTVFLKYMKNDGNHSNYGRSSLYSERSKSKCKSGGLWRTKHVTVRASRNDSGEGEDVQESEDVLQSPVEKGKKVIAMQRNLLKQIAERRCLISSIESSKINPSEEFSAKDDDSSTIVDLGTNQGSSVANEFTTSTISETNINSVHSMVNNDLPIAFPGNPSEGIKEQIRAPLKNLFLDSMQKEAMATIPEKPTSYLDRSLDDDKKETVESLSHETTALVVDSPPKPEESTTLPDILSQTYLTSGLTDEKDQGFKESTSKELSDKVNNLAGEDANLPPLAGANVMNVILVAAECAPWSKTGGLGDVAGSLPKALARRGHRVMVVAPLYGNYPGTQDIGMRKIYRVDGQDIEICYFQTYTDGVDFVFIESPMFRHIGNNVYGGNRQDILKRMILFCKVAVEVPWHVPCGGVCYGDGNLVFIANDWHTALLPVYLKANYQDHGLMKYTRSVLVIHNIAHQGRGPVAEFSYLDLPPHYIDYFKFYDPVGGEHSNILAAGIKAADRIVTVSHGYAWELKTQEGGWGLHGIVNENDWKLRGIVNGIDTQEWDPQFDDHLKSDGYTNYSLETLKLGKAKCKAALQKELDLPVREDVPLLGFIGRLDYQKGVDLIGESVPWLMGQDVQLVMLGTGRHDLEEMLRQFESQHRGKIRGWVGFSVKIAHRITAGADILLMPSRFEPCGLNQLYAMSYGTVPVVHAVGGLRDTVQPFDPYNGSGFGWTFDRAESSCLINALGNCLSTYREYKESWEGLQRRGMTQDLSWNKAAEHYEEVLVAAKYHW